MVGEDLFLQEICISKQISMFIIIGGLQDFSFPPPPPSIWGSGNKWNKPIIKNNFVQVEHKSAKKILFYMANKKHMLYYLKHSLHIHIQN